MAGAKTEGRVDIEFGDPIARGKRKKENQTKKEKGGIRMRHGKDIQFRGKTNRGMKGGGRRSEAQNSFARAGHFENRTEEAKKYAEKVARGNDSKKRGRNESMTTTVGKRSRRWGRPNGRGGSSVIERRQKEEDSGPPIGQSRREGASAVRRQLSMRG